MSGNFNVKSEYLLCESAFLMRSILIAFGRALYSQLHYRMLLLTLVPFVFAVVLWGVVLYFGLQPVIDAVQRLFMENEGFKIAGNLLAKVGLSSLKTLIVPLIVMWVLLPLMIVSALIFIALFAMPVIVKHVASRHYPALQERKGGSFWGSLWMGISSILLFVVLWIVTLPLSAIPPLAFLTQMVLWGWLTCRVFSYDALSDHASAQERKDILRLHRWPLLVIGAITGMFGVAPTVLWLGGALFPPLAGIAIWLHVLVFIFAGLWFQYYCLEALDKFRAADASAVLHPQAEQPFKDIN